jgi:hypothetical protein
MGTRRNEQAEIMQGTLELLLLRTLASGKSDAICWH